MACVAMLTSSVCAGAQDVVFSRRVYQPQGRSFQEIWAWSPGGGLRALTRSARDHDRPECSPDGTVVFFGSGSSRWRFDRRTGVEDPVGDGPSAPAAHHVDPSLQCDDRTLSPSPDGSRLACASNGEEIVIVDRRSAAQIDRVRFDQRYSTGDPYPPLPLQSVWSPEGGQLLVGTYGEDSSSTSYALDYFVLELASRQWTRAFTGNDAVWLTGTTIASSTPRDLAPLAGSSKQVWTAQLAVYDLTTQRRILLTSGVSNNVQPTLCGSR